MHEPHLAAQRNNLFAHLFHHTDQTKRTDVRFTHVHDFRRRAGFYKFAHHLPAQMARILDLAVELAIGKCTRAAFAELHI